MSGLVQEISGSTTGTTLTLTLPAPATIGNSVVLALSGFQAGSVSTITIGGVGGQFGVAAAPPGTTDNAQIWWCSPVPVASATIVVTASTAGIIGFAYEVATDGAVAGFVSSWVDAAWSDTGTGTSWTSLSSPSTIPLAEFVVGIGATDGAGSVTVTGPGSGGWTNQTPVNGVHAGSVFYSAVSGYQMQGAASASYTYSGTASGSAGWAGAVATFLLLPMFDNWAGYLFTEHDSYTGIQATFTLPSLSGQPTSAGSIWVGLGDVYQAGVTMVYDTGHTGNVALFCWDEFVPGPFENWSTSAYPAAAGDSVTVALQLTGANWVAAITNHTQAWSHTETKSVLAVNIGQLAAPPNGPAVWPYPLGQAEVIVEDEGDEFAGGSNPDYGTITFTSITTTPAASAAPQAWATFNTNINQYPGPYTAAAGVGSFTVTWNSTV